MGLALRGRSEEEFQGTLVFVYVPDAESGLINFFISYAGPDRPWAEWVGEQLIAAGYSVELDVWDWAAGSNVVLNMNDALARTQQVVALFSGAYFERRRFTLDEWTAVLAERPDGEGRRRLVPLRVEEVTPPPILASLVYRDLFGLDEQQAREALLAAVRGTGQRVSSKATFPGPAANGSTRANGPRVPGSYPALWNVPPRNPAFTGREALLFALRERLTSGNRALVQAFYGLGGVGKTQLAIEYAHLFAGEYELVWWIDAERSELIGEQLSALAMVANWVYEGTIVTAAVERVMARLREMPRWLIVFDNAESAEDIRSWLPPDTGHVIITSRSGGFAGLAVPVEVDVFARAESVTLLQQHLPMLTDHDADRLAAALGDLPLALAQVVGVMTETRMPVEEYLAELTEHATDLLMEKKPLGYPRSLAAAIAISVSRLGGEDPAAVQLLHLCCLLAPEPIPLRWFTSVPAGVLDEPLATVITARLAWRRTLGRLSRFGLARLTEQTLQLHRLTQAVLRERHSLDQRQEERQRAEELLKVAEPEDNGTDPASWPAWVILLPHLLALDPVTAGLRLRETVCNAMWYLLMRGEYGAVIRLGEASRQHWLADLGPDQQVVLWAATLLATGHRLLGNYEQARHLDEDTLARCRSALGEDHPDTLISANNLASDLRRLGHYELARCLDEDTLARCRRVLGDDHFTTLTVANNLAGDLRRLGHYELARCLDEDTLARCRRVLGDDHPTTLTSANNLANDLHELGDHEQARLLDEDTLDRCRRVFGEGHPDTLRAANNLAFDLRNLGDYEEARRLDEETFAYYKSLLGDDHPDTLIMANNLAVDFRHLELYEQARLLDEDTLARRRRILDDDHPDTLNSANNLASDLRCIGHYEQAFHLDQDTLTRFRRVLGDDHPHTIISANNLADDLRLLNE